MRSWQIGAPGAETVARSAGRVRTARSSAGDAVACADRSASQLRRALKAASILAVPGQIRMKTKARSGATGHRIASIDPPGDTRSRRLQTLVRLVDAGRRLHSTHSVFRLLACSSRSGERRWPTASHVASVPRVCPVRSSIALRPARRACPSRWHVLRARLRRGQGAVSRTTRRWSPRSAPAPRRAR